MRIFNYLNNLYKYFISTEENQRQEINLFSESPGISLFSASNAYSLAENNININTTKITESFNDIILTIKTKCLEAEFSIYISYEDEFIKNLNKYELDRVIYLLRNLGYVVYRHPCNISIYWN